MPRPGGTGPQHSNKIRCELGLDWVTPHAFRRTVATIIDRDTDADTAAEQPGHSNEQVTRRHYIAKRAQGPDARRALEQAVEG